METLAAVRAATPRNIELLGDWATNAARNIQEGQYINTPSPNADSHTAPPKAPSAPPKASSAPLGAHLPAHPDNDPKAMAHFTDPGDNVQATGITGKDSAGNVQQVYKNEFAPGSADYNEYGRAIYSDSKRGATKRGFEQDFAKTGNYVGDPATGKGMSLPPTVGQGGRTGLGELSPQETQAMMMGYGPARQAGLQAMRDNANLEVMRQWKGKDLANAPPEVKDLFGKPQGLETLVERHMADTLSPEGQARRQQHETQLAALKAAGSAARSGSNRGNDYTKTVASAFKDHFGEQANDSMLTMALDLAPWIQQYEPDPYKAASLLYQVTRGMPSLGDIDSSAQQAGEKGWFVGSDERQQRSQAEHQRLMQLNSARVKANIEKHGDASRCPCRHAA